MIYLVQEKLASPRIGGSYGVTPDDIRWITTLLIEETEIVTVSRGTVAAVTGDAEDDYVLAVALLGRADALITGDRALLARQFHQQIPILSPRSFMDRLDEVPES